MSIRVNPNTLNWSFNNESGSEELHIIRKSLEAIEESHYVWTGEIYFPKNDKTVGDAVFVQDGEGNITGTIDIEGLFFSIQPLKNSGFHVLIEFDGDEIENRNKRLAKESSPYNFGGDTETNLSETLNSSLVNLEPIIKKINLKNHEALANCPVSTTRALVVYTSGAASYGNIDGNISLALSETNFGYNNSNIYNLDIVLAHKQQVSFNESSSIIFDLQQLIDDTSIQNLRDQYDADVVVLLTEAGAYLGGDLGRAGTLHLENDKAYAIVDVSSVAGPDYVFAHEVGHLQAAQHHPDDISSSVPPVYNYGYGHRYEYNCGFLNLSKCRRSTIMAYPYSSSGTTYSTRKYFSNPNLSDNGEPMGISNTRENYRALKNTAATVSDFRDPYELGAIINTTVVSSNSFIYSGTPCGGSGSYSYEWRTSRDPISEGYGGIVSTSQNYSATFNDPGQWFIQLKINSTTGHQAIEFTSTYVEDPGGCQPTDPCSFKFNPEINDKPTTIELLPAWPNPFNPTTKISFTLPVSDYVSVNVFDMSGRHVASLWNGNKSAGTHNFDFNAGTLASGVYLIRLETTNVVRTQTITLVK